MKKGGHHGSIVKWYRYWWKNNAFLYMYIESQAESPASVGHLCVTHSQSNLTDGKGLCQTVSRKRICGTMVDKRVVRLRPMWPRFQSSFMPNFRVNDGWEWRINMLFCSLSFSFLVPDRSLQASRVELWKWWHGILKRNGQIRPGRSCVRMTCVMIHRFIDCSTCNLAGLRKHKWEYRRRHPTADDSLAN